MNLEPRIYTFGEVLAMAGLTVDAAFDRRRIKVGGLGFDSLDQTFRLPDTADGLIVTLDDKPHTSFTITKPVTPAPTAA